MAGLGVKVVCFSFWIRCLKLQEWFCIDYQCGGAEFGRIQCLEGGAYRSTGSEQGIFAQENLHVSWRVTGSKWCDFRSGFDVSRFKSGFGPFSNTAAPSLVESSVLKVALIAPSARIKAFSHRKICTSRGVPRGRSACFSIWIRCLALQEWCRTS